MNNIFEGAYFGKAYKTRDGRKAIYNYHSSGGYHDIIIDEEGVSYHFADHTNGILRLPHPSEINTDVDYSCPIDIVSEWQEEIDEEELAKQYAENSLFGSKTKKQIAYCAYLKGYRKALKKIKIDND